MNNNNTMAKNTFVITQPSKVVRKPGSPFVTFFYPNGADPEFMFCRAAIAFPVYEQRLGKFIGAISVVAMNTVTKRMKLMRIEHFDLYSFRFFEMLRKINEAYGITEYYFNDANDQDRKRLVDVVIREEEAGKRIIRPHLTRVVFSSDFSAYNPLFNRLAQRQFFYSSRSPFATAAVMWDDTKPFKDAPVDMQAVCINVAGIENDFGYYRDSLYDELSSIIDNGGIR